MDSFSPNASILGHETEADTCRKEVTPKLKASGWDDDKILEQRTFTSGKVVVVGRKAKRQKAKKADYLLRYSTDFLLAVVEAKRRYKSAGDGLQQAKEYAEILKLKFAYATNGHVALSRFLLYYLLTPEGIEKINDASPGTADRNRTLGTAALSKIEVPVPPLAAQQTFLTLQARLHQLITTQQAAQAELDLLLPATLDKAFRGEL